MWKVDNMYLDTKRIGLQWEGFFIIEDTITGNQIVKVDRSEPLYRSGEKSVT